MNKIQEIIKTGSGSKDKLGDVFSYIEKQENQFDLIGTYETRRYLLLVDDLKTAKDRAWDHICWECDDIERFIVNSLGWHYSNYLELIRQFEFEDKADKREFILNLIDMKYGGKEQLIEDFLDVFGVPHCSENEFESHDLISYRREEIGHKDIFLSLFYVS